MKLTTDFPIQLLSNYATDIMPFQTKTTYFPFQQRFAAVRIDSEDDIFQNVCIEYHFPLWPDVILNAYSIISG